MAVNNDEFYVGYLPQAPNQIAGHVRKFILAAFCAAAILAVLFVIAQRPFAASFFEFLQPRAFSGILLAKPHPTLAVLRPGKTGELPVYSRYYLVNPGKFGVAEEAAKWHGQQVKLRGSLIYRDDQTMIEVEPGSIVEQASTAAQARHTAGARTLGTFTLAGEIVDSKCFLGVMNPGDLKTHKACAVRCIAGGSPPLFIVQQSSSILYFLLTSTDDQSIIPGVLDLVARRIEIDGEVLQEDNLLILRADPANYRALD